MRIGIITLDNPFRKIHGGIESVVYNLTKAFVSLGHEVWILCSDDIKSEIVIGTRKIRLWLVPNRGLRNVLLKSLLFALHGWRVLRGFERENVTIFNCQGGYAVPILLRKTVKSKIVLTVHTLDGENIARLKDCVRLGKMADFLTELVRFLIAKIWRNMLFLKAHYLIFVSHNALSEFKRYYKTLKFLKKPILLIPNGAPETVKYLRRACLAKRFNFIYVGRIDKCKCVDVIIHAARILKKRGYSFSIAIVGHGPYIRDLESLIKKYGLEDCIKILGYLDYSSTLEHICESRFLILPSLYESDPLVVKEALSLGVPCIVSNIPTLEEKIKNNVNGFTFKGCDPLNLAKTIEKALKLKESEYRRLVVGALTSFKSLTWINIAKMYISFFNTINSNSSN